MTGTARTSAREFRKIYRTPVIRVPTNRPVLREKLPARVYGTSEQKWEAIVEEVKRLNEAGRPVLIGTRSIDKSETLSELLQAADIEHCVLNANEIAKEADIVALAGHEGRVTVATNMAGRGTDIKLESGVAELGGLQVIGTEMHDAARIDRQLYGRCGRQGDPGSYRQYLALDDDIIRTGFGPNYADKVETQGKQADRPADRYAGVFRRAQKKVERKHLRDRRMLLHHEK